MGEVMTLNQRIEIQPQPGPQTAFLSSSADIAIYGGAAGSGKTFALLLENCRYHNNSKFGSVIFRRTSNQITTEGGLWDTALSLFAPFEIKIKTSPQHQIKFPSGSKISFSHLQLERDVHAWQGAQIPLICFEELTHFTKGQFFYMLSRNRSLCGVRPYIRATTNPDADSWVADFIQWWIGEDGYPVKERSGVIRWFIRMNDEIIWADTPKELSEKYRVPLSDPKSLTFIAADIFDNQILLNADPGYLANLKSLGTVERERLLHGNWKIRPSAGLYFRRDQINVIPELPKEKIQWVRRWDLAATEPTEANPSPDATAGVLMGRKEDGRYVIADVIEQRINAAGVRSLIKNTAESDKATYGNIKIVIPQDPGQAGKSQAQDFIKLLSGFSVSSERETGNKIIRSEPLSAQWQAGNIDLVAGAWNEKYLAQMESFPESSHDDMVDASSGAFTALGSKSPMKINPAIIHRDPFRNPRMRRF